MLLSVMQQPGGRAVWRRRDTCICMAESLLCSRETITILIISYIPIQNKKLKNKCVSMDQQCPYQGGVLETQGGFRLPRSAESVSASLTRSSAPPTAWFTDTVQFTRLYLHRNPKTTCRRTASGLQTVEPDPQVMLTASAHQVRVFSLQ